ncbi:MAG: hypothetical protein E7667_06870 [Ruminococcaceae bacterium]|nr:hypothetical protein [Oscillospiraceae bacterium]
MKGDDKNKIYDDSFWDLSSESKKINTPSNTPQRHISAPYVKTEYVTASAPQKQNYTSSPLSKSDDGTITRYISPQKKAPDSEKNLIFSYTPQNPLIKRVEIYTDKGAESIFAQDNLFLRERKALIDRHGKEVPHVPFYSMMPRYSQMTRPQLAYYLWWRENIRVGIWLEADISYAILYAHELIASEDEDKNAVLDKLCRLYHAQCGDKHVAYFGIGSLISDYCILNNLKISDGQLGEKFSEFLAYTGLPEFFIDISDRYSRELYQRILGGVSMYNYKKSKHYPSSPEIFDTHMEMAVASIFENDKAYAAISSFAAGAYGDILTSHKPFFKIPGLTHKNAKIKISYYPMSVLQSPITDALRYCENKIREHLGVKSKLNVTTVNPDIKFALDNYFEQSCPPMSKERIAKRAAQGAEAEYDKFYDVPKCDISPERARQIEAQSWETTKILIETFSEQESYIPDALPAQQPTEQKISIPEQTEENGSLLDRLSKIIGDQAEFLSYCISEDASAQRKFVLSMSVSADEVAEQINQAALELIGDILLEDRGDCYAVIEEYKNLF